MSEKSPWFANMANYLVTRKTPPHSSTREKRNIIQKSASYSLIQGDHFYTEPYFFICRCVREEEMFDILKSSHDEPCSGHFADKRTAYKILRTSYFYLLCLRMPRNMLGVMIVVNEWVNLFKQIKCLYVLKS